MGGGGTIEPEGANWGGADWVDPEEEKQRLALALAMARKGGVPADGPSMVKSLAMGAPPPAPSPPTDPRRAAIAGAIRAGEDLTPFLTQPAPDARPAPTARPMEAALTENLTPPSPDARPPAQPNPAFDVAWSARPKGPNLLAKALEYLPPMMGGGGKPLPITQAAQAMVPTIMRGPSEPPAPPPSAPAAPAAPPSAAPAVANARTPAAPVKPLTAQQGQNIMAALRGPVADTVADATGTARPAAPAPAMAAAPPRAPMAPPAPTGGVPDGPSALELALQQSRGNRLIAQLTRAGGTAIGRGSGPGYDTLDEGADRPLQELSLRQQEAAQQKAAAGLAADSDPNSPQSVMARALVGQVVPGLAKSPGFERASYSTLARGPLAKFIDANADLQNLRIRGQQERDLLRAKQRAAGVGGGAKEADVQKLGKDLENLPQVRADLELLRSTIAQGGDMPGLGWWDSRKPDFLQSGEDVRVRQAARRVLNARLHALGGANVTPQEFERISAGYGLGPGALEGQSATGIQSLISDTDADVRSKIAKYAPGVAAKLSARGFDTSPIGGSQAATPATGSPSADDLERLWGGG